jgi:hypothetical protein
VLYPAFVALLVWEAHKPRNAAYCLTIGSHHLAEL